MNILLPLIILVLLGCIYAGSLKTPRSRLCVVMCVLLMILVLCYVQMKGNHEGFSGGYAPLDYIMSNGRYGKECNTSKEGSISYADINSKIGPGGSYDGVILKSQLVTKPINDKNVIWSPVGDGYVIKDALSSENYPTVDGNPGSPKSMFMFKNNEISWDCEGSTNIYTDMGPVCYSPEQVKLFQSRGRNLSPPQEYPGI